MPRIHDPAEVRIRRFIRKAPWGIAAGLIAALIATAAHQMGWLLTPEMAVYDALLRSTRGPTESPVILVMMTARDLDSNNSSGGGIREKNLTEALRKIVARKPRLVGVDVLLEEKTGDPGRDELLDFASKNPHVIFAEYRRSASSSRNTGPKLAPAGLAAKQKGFVDFPQDEDGTTRRGLIYMDSGSGGNDPGPFVFSLPYTLADSWLGDRVPADALQEDSSGDHKLILSSSRRPIRRFRATAGGYTERFARDEGGFQFFLDFHDLDVASEKPTILKDVDNCGSGCSWKDKLVLLGYEDPLDMHRTPLRVIEGNNYSDEMPGVELLARTTYQLIRTGENTGPLPLTWLPDWQESTIIGVFALASAMLVTFGGCGTWVLLGRAAIVSTGPALSLGLYFGIRLWLPVMPLLVASLTAAAASKVAAVRWKRVFISYASEDLNTALRVRRCLREAGHDPVIDKEFLEPGKDWSPQIDRAIRTSDAFIVCISSAYIRKFNLKGIITNEVTQASDQWSQRLDQNAIFPVLVASCEGKIPFDHSRQMVDLTQESGCSDLRRVLS